MSPTLSRKPGGSQTGAWRELVIVSQDTLAFGKDLGIERGTIRLLEGLLGVDGLRWIRLLYCYPNLLSDELVEMIGNQDRLCSYFDIPYQHASPRIMERMRRGGGREMFHRQVENVRDRVPEAGLRTSFIVGFPGETPEDFDDLLGFVEDVRFDNLGVFLYSDEDGTSAYNLDGKVDRDTAIERRDLLMQRQAVITGERLEGMVGRKMDGHARRIVFRDGPSARGPAGDAGARDRRTRSDQPTPTGSNRAPGDSTRSK